jgi:hypothetical protein
LTLPSVSRLLAYFLHFWHLEFSFSFAATSFAVFPSSCCCALNIFFLYILIYSSSILSLGFSSVFFSSLLASHCSSAFLFRLFSSSSFSSMRWKAAHISVINL